MEMCQQPRNLVHLLWTTEMSRWFSLGGGVCVYIGGLASLGGGVCVYIGGLVSLGGGVCVYVEVSSCCHPG